MKSRQVLFLTLLLAAAALMTPSTASADHFRSGNLSWSRTSTTGQVRFSFVAAFERSVYTGTASDGKPRVGDFINEASPGLYFGDGNSLLEIRYRVIEISAAHNWILAEAVEGSGSNPPAGILHTYSGSGPYTAYVGTCCRRFLNNRDGTFFRLETIVSPTGTNSSPVSTIPHIVSVDRAADESSAITFTVPASDPNNDEITFRLATDTEVPGDHPPGLTIDEESGVVTWYNHELDNATYWTVQVMIEDHDANGTLTKTPVDFLLGIGSIDPNDHPHADAGVDQTISCATGNTTVTLNGSASSDPDNDPITYRWTNASNTVVGTTASITLTPGVGIHTYTLVVNDGQENSHSDNVTVTLVADNVAPVPTVSSLQTVTGQCSATVSTVPTATDGCAHTINGTTTDPLTYSTQGTYTIHWTFNDGNGNSSTQNQTVIVDDVTGPVAPVLAAITRECSATVPVPTASDNCVGTVTGTTNDPLVYTAQGTYTVNWSFNDGNGNVTTRAQQVVIDDITSPVPTIASLANATGECSVTVTAPTANDACAGVITATTIDPRTYTIQGTHIVHWTFNDGNGNSFAQNQTVIVDDVTAPVPTSATLATVTGVCSATVTTAPTALDNCGRTITGTTTDPLTYSGDGSYTIHWSYNDGNGNTSTQNQTVVLNDVTAPVVTLATLPRLTGTCAVTISSAPTASDNCRGTINGVTTQSLPFTITAQGTTTIVWTYDDGNGNVVTQNQTVVLDDVTRPVPTVSCLPILRGDCSVTVTAPPTAVDNCRGTVNGTTSQSLPLTITGQGFHYIVWTYDDQNGNSTCQIQLVWIDDNTAPVPSVATLPTVTGQCSATVTAVPTAVDACRGTIRGTTCDPLTYTRQGTYTIRWAFNDGCGNISTQTQTVVVDDVTPPTITVSVSPSTITNPNHRLVEVCATVRVTDNCTSCDDPEWELASITSDEADYGLGNGDVRDDIQNESIGTTDRTYKVRAERSNSGDGRIYTITYRATDANGNSSTGTATVSVPVGNAKQVIESAVTGDIAITGNQPNPFSEQTTINYMLPSENDVTLTIFNTQGDIVRTLLVGTRSAGAQSQTWDGLDNDGRPVASGVYFCQLRAGDVITVSAMTRTR